MKRLSNLLLIAGNINDDHVDVDVGLVTLDSRAEMMQCEKASIKLAFLPCKGKSITVRLTSE